MPCHYNIYHSEAKQAEIEDIASVLSIYTSGYRVSVRCRVHREQAGSQEDRATYRVEFNKDTHLLASSYYVTKYEYLFAAMFLAPSASSPLGLESDFGHCTKLSYFIIIWAEGQDVIERK